MPKHEPKPGLFKRWLLLVYLPLGTFIVALALVLGNILSGFTVWLVVVLGIYCIVPARLILETRRKGLELPKPPGAKGSARPAPGNRLQRPSPRGESRTATRPRRPSDNDPARRRGGDEFDEPVTRRRESDEFDEPVTRRRESDEFDEEPPARRRIAPVDENEPAPRRRAAGLDGDEIDEVSTPTRAPKKRALGASAGGKVATQRIERSRPARPKKSPQVVRRRALASVVGIGVLLLVGGILVIVGIGRVTSSFGLVMVGVGGFLMILSVTLPTFRLVDAALRGIGRLLSRRPQPRRD